MSRLMRLVYILFAVCMSVFIILSLSYLNRLKNLDQNIRQFDHSNAILLQVEQMNGILNANGSKLRTMLILGNKKVWPDILMDNMLLLSKADSLISMTRNNAGQSKKAAEIKAVLEQRYRLIRDETPVYTNQGNINQFIADIGVLRTRYDSLYHSFTHSESWSISQLQQRRDRFDKLTSPALAGLLVFAGFFFLAIFLYLVLTLKKRIFYQNELQGKLQTLDLANKELENLSRVTSHHIQEPMRKIRNFSTMLDKKLDDLDNEEIRQIIGKIETNAGGLQVLAQNLVQYANLIQDTQPKEKVDLNELLNEVCYRLEDLIFETKAEIRKQQLPMINGIPHQLFIVFQELIRNSISFAKQGQTPLIEVIHLPITEPGIITIAVRDHGLGFSSEYAERIFRIFEQLEPRSVPGKGIGLAMCSRVMLNHGGRIRAESNPGAGATFFLDFPA